MSSAIVLSQGELELKPISFNSPQESSIAGNKVLPSELAGISLRDEMKALKNNFQISTPITITTPFQGTALAVSKDQSKYIFSSKESRIAICDSKSQRLILDKVVKESEIWTMALYCNDTLVLAAGTASLIRKLQLPNLVEIDTFSGHSGEINYVVVSGDERWAYSCGDDCTVRKWDLNVKSPESSILYSHNSQVFGMGISNDSSLLCTASGDGAVIAYRLEGELTECNTIIKTLKVAGSMWICRFSPDNSMLAAGGSDTITYIWSTTTWDLLRKFEGHTNRVRCMNFNNAGTVLITGGFDNLMIVWDIIGAKAPVTLRYHENNVRATIVSNDDKFCTSLGDDCKVIRWKIPEFDRVYSLKSDNSVVLALWVTLDKEQIFAITDNYSIKIWEAKTGELKNSYKIDLIDIITHTVMGDRLSAIFYTNIKSLEEEEEKPNILATHINLNTGMQIKTLIINHTTICSSMCTEDNKFLAIGTPYTLDIYNSKDFTLYHNFRNHAENIIALGATTTSDIIFSASTDGALVMSNLYELSNIKKLLRPSPERVITGLQVSTNDDFMFVIENLGVEVFSVKMQSKIFSIREPGVKFIDTNIDDSKIFLFERNSLVVYNSENFSLLYRQLFRAPTSNVATARGCDFWVLYRGAISKIAPTPLEGTKFDCIGKYGEESAFHRYIANIIKDKPQKHNKAFDRWAILPNVMNAVHFYAYYNFPEFLEKALQEDAPFYASRNGHTPLSIALDLKYVGCVRAIIKGLSLRVKEHPLNLFYFDRSLTALNSLGYSGLHRIYEQIFNRALNRSLPKFAVEQPGEIYREGNNLLISPSTFMPPEAYSTDGFSIVFKQSYCKFPLATGSTSSLAFMKSLIDCKNIKIYDTDIIKLLISQKWASIRWIMNIQALIYMSFAILLSIHTIRDRSDKSFIFAPLGVEAILIFYEIVQIIINKSEYFRDPLNIVDIVKAALFIAFFILVQLGETEFNSLLSVLLFITLFRGITYFRLLEDTRYYINLLSEVIYDLIPFLIIFYYATLGFDMIFLALDRENDSDLFNYVTQGYPTDLPNYDSSNFDKAQWLNYFLVTMLISIVMLSLVVSILSDTYARVNENESVANSQALAQMIYECELLYFWNRNKNTSNFIFLCSEHGDNQIEQANLINKVTKLKGLVAALGKKINNNRRLMKNLKNLYIDDTEKITTSIEELVN